MKLRGLAGTFEKYYGLGKRTGVSKSLEREKEGDMKSGSLLFEAGERDGLFAG